MKLQKTLDKSRSSRKGVGLKEEAFLEDRWYFFSFSSSSSFSFSLVTMEMGSSSNLGKASFAACQYGLGSVISFTRVTRRFVYTR